MIALTFYKANLRFTDHLEVPILCAVTSREALGNSTLALYTTVYTLQRNGKSFSQTAVSYVSLVSMARNQLSREIE
jgi:hypothetical protein